MKKKQTLSASFISALVFFGMTCISCAHHNSTDSAALDATDGSDHHVWSESKDVGENLAKEEGAMEEVATADAKELDQEVEATTAQNEAPTTTEEKTEEGGFALAGDSISPEVAKVEEAAAPTTTVARLGSPSHEISPYESSIENPTSAMAVSSVSEDTDSSEVPKRQPNENASGDSATEKSPEPTIGSPATLKGDGNSAPSKHPRKRSSMDQTRSQENKAPEKSEPATKTTQDIQAKIEVAPVVPIVPKVASRQMEESFGHEPIPTKQNEEEEPSEAQLASVEIASFIERHVIAVVVLTLGFVIGLYFVMRRSRENDNNSI